MANLSDIITPTNLVTFTGTDTLTNKDLTSGTNTFPTNLVTLTGTNTFTGKQTGTVLATDTNDYVQLSITQATALYF